MKGVTLAVLAGGKGVRMGMPKAQLVVKGQPILIELIQRLHWEGQTLLVTSPGRESPPGCELFTREVCDSVADEGPVRGMMTALDACATEKVLVIPVDMPGVERAHLDRVAGLLDDKARGVMLMRGGAMAPFPSVWRRTIMEDLRKHLATGARSMRSLMGLAGVRSIEAPRDWGADVWKNLNYPEDLP